jgi:hypothetical protein
MSRWRSTWSDSANPVRREAATVRTADPYTMNQEHPQPSPVEYESGNPDEWAETPANSDPHIKKEYDGDHVKRNEVGFGEFRDDTWSHKDSDQWGGKGKYDNARAAAERKASAVERLARVLLRSDDEKLIEAQACDLMAMPGPVLASTLRRLDQVSPDALPKQVKFRRALACCKLAARLLPANPKEEQVEHIASMLMKVDDPILKEILKTVKVALEEEKPAESEPKPEMKTSGEEKGEPEAKPEPEMKTSGEEKGEEAEEEAEEAEEEAEEAEGEAEGEETAAEQCGCMDPEIRAMLQQMLQQESAEPEHQGGSPAPAPELTDLFEQPEVAPMAGPMASTAAATPEITFDEDDDVRTASDADDNQLANLFADDPEVQAHREIKASEKEQIMRETGFARMASTGAKKIGQVKASKGQEASLEDLWERPGR